MFDDIVTANPENVDALYGLGLAHKASGDMQAAAQAFQRALETTESALAAVKTTSHTEGNVADNDLGTNVDDRYMMLTRMLSQRLVDVGAGNP